MFGRITLARIRVASAVLALFAVASHLSGCKEPAHEAAGSLPRLGANVNETSVSGISSGAYMAGQFQMAQAKRVVGAAIIAGGPYGCSESIFAETMPGAGTALLNLSKAVNGCMLDLLGIWGVADPSDLARKAEARAAKGDIGPIADIINDRIYLFTGMADSIVMPSIVKHAAEFYAKLGVPAANIKLVANLPAGHAFVTDNEGGQCSISAEPYVVDCDYDQAGELLKHIYGPLNPRNDTPTGDYVTFDQQPFANSNSTGMADTGVVYVPKACREQIGCRVHIAFHGCAQNRETVGDAFIKETGFARWADTNRLIVLFPQVETKPINNPQGCWDWWGYTGPQYLTRSAPQIAAVNRMLDALQATGGGA